MLQGMTAHYLVTSTYAVQPGDVALVHAAAGGVGQLLVQMVRASGGASSPPPVGGEGGDRPGARRRARHRLLARSTTSRPRCARLTGGAGVDVVYDGVGKATFDASLASLRPRGMMVLFGGASGQVPPFDIQRLNSGGSLFLTRPTLGHYIATREELRVARRRGARRRGRRLAARSTSAAATRSPRPRRPTTTSRAGARRASSSWSLSA